MKKYELLEETLSHIQEQINRDRGRRAERNDAAMIPTQITLDTRGGFAHSILSYRNRIPSYLISLEIDIDNLLVYKLDHYIDLTDRLVTEEKDELQSFELSVEEFEDIREKLSERLLHEIIGKGLFTAYEEIKNRDIR